jgi:signal transduction histidine kinase
MTPRIVALSELVEHALELNQGLAHKYGVEIVAAQFPVAHVRADPDRLQQVLSNLISNAAKHSPRGGRVEVSFARRGPMVRICVSDQGAGVPESFRDQLFGRFAQSSDGRQRGGSGLGLAICKEIIERSGGRIGYDPGPGGGALFWFDLPGVTSAQQTGATD